MSWYNFIEIMQTKGRGACGTKSNVARKSMATETVSPAKYIQTLYTGGQGGSRMYGHIGIGATYKYDRWGSKHQTSISTLPNAAEFIV